MGVGALESNTTDYANTVASADSYFGSISLPEDALRRLQFLALRQRSYSGCYCLLCRCAAETAGKRRRNIGGDNHLFGRFLRRELRAGRWRRAGRRIDQAAVLDDLANLRSVERLVFKQGTGYDFEFFAVREKDLFGARISAVNQFTHFLVDLLGGGLAVIAGARDIAAEKDVILMLAVFYHAHPVTHAPLANHLARESCRHLDVTARAAGHVPENNFLRHPAAHANYQVVE
jgi:hypothetical protein